MSWTLVCVLLLLASCEAVRTGIKSYTGYHLLSIPILSKQDRTFVSQLQNGDLQVDVWSEPRQVGHNATVAVPPGSVSSVIAALAFAGMDTHIVTNDLQGWIDALKDSVESEASEASEASESAGRSRRPFRLNKYHRHAEINRFLEVVSGRCREGVYSEHVNCEVLTIGESYEGRPMNVLHIFPTATDKVPAIWIDAGIHAREWAAPATAIFLIYKILDTAGEPETQHLLTQFQWYILPSANPDGYEHTHTTDRMWRKTRSPNAGADCIGVDPNRNWDFHWNEIGASNYACSDIYAGPEPFSEPETRAMAGFLLDRRDQMLVYLTIHSFGQYWLTPWGYTEELPEDYDDLVDVADTAVKAIHAERGLHFTVGSSTNVLYAAAGGSDDWAKGVCGIKYAFTVELRDNGRYGFLMPRSGIVPSGMEMWAGVKTMAERVLTHVEEGRTDF